ncbi:unnamed protein product [Rhizophagus irregularis]|nr:unnamed protein product [Rhizophagus irregularis]
MMKVYDSGRRNPLCSFLCHRKQNVFTPSFGYIFLYATFATFAMFAMLAITFAISERLFFGQETKALLLSQTICFYRRKSDGSEQKTINRKYTLYNGNNEF